MLGAALLFATQAIGIGGGWPTYMNARFGYSICRPATFRAAPEAANGDGRVFSDGVANLRVFGSYGLDGASAASQAEEAATTLRGGHITYRANGAHWGVVSGRAGARVFYVKALTRDDRVMTMELDYPASADRRYAGTVKGVQGCFTALSAPF